MTFLYTASFRRDYRKLPLLIRKAVNKQLGLLALDRSHPSLHFEPIGGKRGIYSIRVDRRWRISLEFSDTGVITIRRISLHDDLYSSP